MVITLKEAKELFPDGVDLEMIGLIEEFIDKLIAQRTFPDEEFAQIVVDLPDELYQIEEDSIPKVVKLLVKLYKDEGKWDVHEILSPENKWQLVFNGDLTDDDSQVR